MSPLKYHSTLFNDLTKKPYTYLPFPLSYEILEKSMNDFLKFLDLPEPLKHHIDLKISPLHRRGDIGFKHRDPQEDLYSDSKDFFHFHPIILKKYKVFLEENPIIHTFMHTAQILWEAIYTLTSAVMKSFDIPFPGTHAKIFDTQNPHIILRFLKYDWTTSGRHLAKPHFDAGSFTLALAESSPGLRIGKGPEDLEIVNPKKNHALFMVSSNYKKLLPTDDALSPAWHDVIQLDETHMGKPFARWAIVGFIDGHGVASLPRTHTHKWTIRE